MNQKTLNCKYIYDSITENENVYTLQKKNNSTQTINGYELKLKNLSTQLTYNSNTNLFQYSYFSVGQNSFTLFYVFVNIEIIKPENNNITFYQIYSKYTRNDDAFAFPANSGGLIDTINYIYITSSVIANGTRIDLYLGGFDQSENLVDISQCTVNLSLKSYPIVWSTNKLIFL